jgi:magnesium chelatase subunit D
VGVRADRPRGGRRLDVLETIRAAAPWQPLRRSGLKRGRRRAEPPGWRLEIRPADFRVKRFVRRAGTTLVLLVDASGSSALHRLGEAKGAVELLLAGSYVRRDRVALISFRGRTAELLLPPTRSLARAKRALAGMPGGGGTPLAAGIDAARAVAALAQRPGVSEGGPALVVLLTDGRPNVARDGTGGRERAETDALASARSLRADHIRALVIDTAPRPGPFAVRLASAMGSRHVPLPSADAATLSRAVHDAVRDERADR